MPIANTETLIEGSWEFVRGHMIANGAVERIRSLVRHELTKVAVSKDGWETLYQDPQDGRYWELTYLYPEMQGGGPESLRFIDDQAAQQKFGTRSR